VTAGIALLPVGWAYRLAGFLGSLAYRVDGRYRRRTLKHLDLAYGDSLGDAEKRRIAKEAFRSLARVGVDVVWLPRLLRPDRRDRYLEYVNLEAADEARRTSSRAIYVTAHYGSWEAVSAAMALAGHSFRAVARPFPNPRINRWVLRSREALGQRIVGKFGAISELVREVRRGESLGFVADQDARRHGIFVDFFGRPSSTTPGPALLAVKFGLPVIVGCGRRIGNGFRFRVIVTAVLRPEPGLPRDEAVRRLTQAMNDAMERFIREEPGQYLWLHRRWKTRPEESREARNPVRQEARSTS
jgi:KDO2-lipid IV(A) lauroyltransferase